MRNLPENTMTRAEEIREFWDKATANFYEPKPKLVDFGEDWVGFEKGTYLAKSPMFDMALFAEYGIKMLQGNGSELRGEARPGESVWILWTDSRTPFGSAYVL